MTDTEVAMELHRQVQSSNEEWSTAAVFRKHTRLKSAIASHLAYAVRSTSLEYVSATISDLKDDDAVVRVIAFTPDTVVVITDTASPTSTVIPRSALKSVSLHEVPQLLGNDWTGGSRFRVGLDYGSVLPEEPPITLGHAYQTGPNAFALEGFIPSLLDDLQR